MDKKVIALDFDGTCTTHDFPRIGADIDSIPVLKKLVSNGHKIILFTMRSNSSQGDYLTDAVQWFKDNDIPLYGVQAHPTQHSWTSSPKCYANLIIDDTGLGVPLKEDSTVSNRPFVDWSKVEILLEKLNYFQ